MIWIYLIRCVDSGKVYVGQTNNINARRSYHMRRLLLQKHDNLYLQNIYNKYGKDRIIMESVEEVDTRETATVRELYWINHYRDQGICINIATHAVVKDKSQSTRERLKNRKMDYGASMRGKLHTQDTKERMSEAHGWSKVIMVHSVYGEEEVTTLTGFAQKYGLDVASLSKVINQRKHYNSCGGWKLKGKENA